MRKKGPALIYFSLNYIIFRYLTIIPEEVTLFIFNLILYWDIVDLQCCISYIYIYPFFSRFSSCAGYY